MKRKEPRALRTPGHGIREGRSRMRNKEYSATDTRDLHIQVDEARRRIRELDPGAYPGFVTDAAIRVVSERRGMDWRYVLRAWRAEHPVPRGSFRSFPAGARHPSREAVEAARCGS